MSNIHFLICEQFENTKITGNKYSTRLRNYFFVYRNYSPYDVKVYFCPKNASFFARINVAYFLN